MSAPDENNLTDYAAKVMPDVKEGIFILYIQDGNVLGSVFVNDTAHSACPCQGTSKAEAGISTALTEQEWQTDTLSELRRRSRLTLTRTDYFNRDNSPGLFSSGEFYRSVKGMQTAFAGVEPRTQSRAAIGITPVPCLCAVCISHYPRYRTIRKPAACAS